jgi:hypothetical protein
VAEEIRTSIEQDFDDDEIGKISFICHSLGGIIAREAISHLLDYRHLFHAYVSLASPHLGITGASKHIKFGLWVSEIFVTYECVTQLKLQDETDFEDSFLFKLSKKQGLEYFEHVYFFASHQDTLVPYSSARMQVFKEDIDRKQSSKIFVLAQNTLENMYKGVIRVDVDFNLNNSLDSFIGRTAHLAFISDKKFLRALVVRYQNIFS